MSSTFGQNKRNWKAKRKQNKRQERGSGLFNEEDEEVGEKEIGEMGLRQRGGDFLAAAGA